nr:MAG TPA_asm: Large polyvalent protein associated domain 38 [Caudoviricetes sp.]
MSNLVDRLKKKYGIDDEELPTANTKMTNREKLIKEKESTVSENPNNTTRNENNTRNTTSFRSRVNQESSVLPRAREVSGSKSNREKAKEYSERYNKSSNRDNSEKYKSFNSLSEMGKYLLQNSNQVTSKVTNVLSGLEAGEINSTNNLQKKSNLIGLNAKQGIFDNVIGVASAGLTPVMEGLKGLGKLTNNENLYQYGNSGQNALKSLQEVNSYGSQVASKVDSNVLRTASNVSRTIGNMAPSIALSALTGGTSNASKVGSYLLKNSGGLLQATNVAGNETLRTLDDENSNYGKSALTGVLKGTVEYGTEKITGGNILAKGTSLDRMVSEGIANNIKSKIGQRLLSKGYEYSGEVAEEIISDTAGNFIDKIVNGKDLPSLKEWWANSKETAKETIITTAILDLLGVGGGTYQEVKELSLNKQQQAELDKAIQDTNTELTNNIFNDNIEQRPLLNEKNRYNVKAQEENLITTAQKYDINYKDTRLTGIQNALDKKGIKSKFDDTQFTNPAEGARWSMTTDENGNVTREIVLNPNANEETIVQELAIHELTHDIVSKNTETSKKLYDEVVDYLKKDEEFNTYYNQLKEMYKDKYNAENTIEEEAVAKALQTKFGTQEEVTRLVNYKPTLARRIYDWVVDKLNNITGGRIEKLYWEDVRNKFERAYNEEYNAKGNQDKSRYSIETDGNGNQYVKVNTDQDIFEGIEEKDYNKVAKMYIQDYLMGETTLSKNNTAIIDRKSANKYTNPGKRQQNFTEKMQLTPELKNVLSIAQKESASLPTKDISKYSNWEYYKFKFELSGKSFEGTVNIGIDSNGNRHFYEINKIKEVSDISGTSLNRSDTSSIDNSIASTNENVNTTEYSMQKSENNANSANSSSIKYSIAGKIGMKNAIQNDYSNRVIEQSYNQALQLKDRGVDNESIRQSTNWFQDKNGDWKFEFSDKDMTIKQGVQLKQDKNYKLGNILEHDILFEVYPELKDYKVEINHDIKASGIFRKQDNKILLNSNIVNNKQKTEGTLIHEIQHAIQNIEGFEGGMSSKLSRLAYYNSLGEIEATDTKSRFLNEKYKNKDMSNIAPESSKANPQHKKLNKYLKDRKLLDKVKDSVYNYFDKKGGNSYEVSNEKYQGSKRKNNSKVSKNVLQENGEGLRKTWDRLGDNRRGRLETEKGSNKKSSFANENIDTYLEKRIGKTGIRTTLKELKLSKAENADSFSSKQKIENNIKTEKATKQEIAKILEQPVDKVDKKSRAWAIVKASLIDKGIVFEELANKTNNRDLQGKWDYTLSANARGQYAIGNDRYIIDPKSKTKKQISKSLEAIRTEVEHENINDFQNYMYHLLNIDRMTLQDRYGIDNKPVFGDNIGAEFSRQQVAKYEKNNPKFKLYAQDVYDFLDANMQELVDKGVVSKELKENLKERYPHYVPIKRVDTRGKAIQVPLDTRRTGVNTPLKKATGGSTDIQPLFQTIADRTMQTYTASARNNFGVELMNTLNSNKISEQTDIETIVEQITESNEELLKKGKNGELPTFTVFDKGQKVTFEISENMYDALKPVNQKLTEMSNSKLAKGLNKVNNFRRGVLTEYNPLFLITNGIKDAQDVLLNSQHATKTYAKIPEAYAQIVKKGYWFEEYIQNGGEQNSYFKDGEFTSDKKTSVAKKAIQVPLEKISQINNVVEMAPRLAEYIASREKGASIETAMLDAARVTTNFKAGGDVTKFANRNGATFLNASVQGAMQVVRNVKEANAKGIKGWTVLAGKTIVAGLPAIILNNMFWGDDDDYEELQDYVKDSYYCIAKIGDGKFIRIPKGRAVATIQKLVNNIDEYINNKKELNIDNFTKDFWEDIGFAMDNLAPNNPLDNNVISPIIQAVTNTSWYGEDIVPSRLQNKPKEEQYDESIDSLSIWLGDKLKVSPYKVNYLLDQYSGGIGDVVLPMMTKQAENNVIEDKFTTDSVMKSRYPGEFFEKLDELKVKANSSKATDEDVLKYKYASKISSSMSELYNKKRKIQNSDDSDESKKKQLKEVQKKINELARSGASGSGSINISGNTAIVGNSKYYKTTDVSTNTKTWKELSETETKKNKKISLKTYANYKETIAQETLKQRKNGTISADGSIKSSDKIEILYNSKYSNEEKTSLYENYIKSKDDVKYDIIKTTGLNINSYLGYKLASSNGEFDSDKEDDGTEKGKTVKNSAKKKLYEYVNNIKGTTYTQRLILTALEYKPEKESDKALVVNYINSLNNLTESKRKEMLNQFKGITIYKDGRIKY